MKKEIIGSCTLYNADCIKIMAQYPDKYFNLAIVDPPYGIGQNWAKDTASPLYKYRGSYKNKSIPSEKYFKELFRISDIQIIWGGNYYTKFLPPTGAWLFWDKKRSEKTFNAQGELAWTSLKSPLRIIPLQWNGFVTCEPRYGGHPHEKPIKLYEWLLTRYAGYGMNILDTHLGSGSIAVACHNLGFSLTACEIDKHFFRLSCKRLKETIGGLIDEKAQ